VFLRQIARSAICIARFERLRSRHVERHLSLFGSD
jgi:hypothetical protein